MKGEFSKKKIKFCWHFSDSTYSLNAEGNDRVLIMKVFHVKDMHLFNGLCGLWSLLYVQGYIGEDIQSWGELENSFKKLLLKAFLARQKQTELHIQCLCKESLCFYTTQFLFSYLPVSLSLLCCCYVVNIWKKVPWRKMIAICGRVNKW